MIYLFLILEDIIISVYQSLGCWADAPDWWNPEHRTIPSLEGTDARLMDEYRMRKDPIGKNLDELSCNRVRVLQGALSYNQ